MIVVRADDPQSPAAAALIAEHFAIARGNTPEGYAFVLGADGLRAPGVMFFTAWDGDALAGMGALKDMGGGHAELKSMRTASGHLRKGVGAAVVAHLVAAARAQGLTRLNLETGKSDDYFAARALYRRTGFVDCAAFADYPADSPYNCYMTLAL